MYISSVFIKLVIKLVDICDLFKNTGQNGRANNMKIK